MQNNQKVKKVVEQIESAFRKHNISVNRSLHYDKTTLGGYRALLDESRRLDRKSVV